MALGIDPKNDYAFKYVFGSEQRKGILIHILNAVLQPPPESRIQSVEIRNPISEQVALDEKYCILDIKVRDQSGQQYNVEMQMTIPPSLPSRLLYYWADAYRSQLTLSDDYDQLQPVISICFLDGILFRKDRRCHLHFQLREVKTQTTFSEQLELHLFQLPLFKKSADELETALDKWLYFLNNGVDLDPGQLPPNMQEPEINEAARALDMFTKDELERERYDARERARRDRLSWENTLKRAEQKAIEAEQKALQAEQKAVQAEQKAIEGHAEGRAEGRAEVLIDQIQLLERLAEQPATPEDKLRSISLEELQQLAKQLGEKLLG